MRKLIAGDRARESVMMDAATKASIFQRLHPKVYFERFVSENIRPDGRDFDAWRDVSANVGTNLTFREPSQNLIWPFQARYRQRMDQHSFVWGIRRLFAA
jgi:hypothetical protein